MKKITLYTLWNKLQSMERMISNMVSPRYYDPTEYITHSEAIEAKELVLIYNNIYFRVSQASSMSKVLAASNITIPTSTLKTIAGNSSRWNELWALGISTHYILPMKNPTNGELYPYYISTNGFVLRKNNLTPLPHQVSHGTLTFQYASQTLFMVRSEWVYKLFVDSNIGSNSAISLFHSNGDLGDCNIDNIRLNDYTRK